MVVVVLELSRANAEGCKSVKDPVKVGNADKYDREKRVVNMITRSVEVSYRNTLIRML